MNYLKRIIQAAFLLGVIWLTIQNYDMKVNLKLFNKEIADASIVIVIFFSVLLGALISAFFSAWKEYKGSKAHRKNVKELKALQKELDIKTKDLTIAEHEINNLNVENEKLNNEINTLKEVIKYPQGSSELPFESGKLLE